jgi:hypothetical protein
MTTSSRWPLAAILRAALVGAAALALVGPPIASQAQEPDPGSADEAVCAVVEAPADCIPVATPIEPDPSVVDARPTPWDHIVVAADGRSLEVYFWMGVTECHGLHSVTVSQGEDGLSVALMTGLAPGGADRVCIEIAQLYVTTVTLETPLIGNVS